MNYKIVIPGRLPSLNEYINSQRSGYRAGAASKKKNQSKCIKAILAAVPGLRIEKPVWITYSFYEINKRRDLDNISGPAHKIINDALVTAKVLQNDGWKEISGYTDRFYVDSRSPRIEIEIEEVDNGR